MTQVHLENDRRNGDGDRLSRFRVFIAVCTLTDVRNQLRLKTVDLEAMKAKLAGVQNELRIRVTFHCLTYVASMTIVRMDAAVAVRKMVIFPFGIRWDYVTLTSCNLCLRTPICSRLKCDVWKWCFPNVFF